MNFTIPGTTLFFLLAGLLNWYQNPPEDKTQSPLVSADVSDEISDLSGVYIRDSAWRELPDVAPFRVRVKRGVLHAFTYGAVPAAVVAEYDGPHSQIQVTAGRPTICICHSLSSPTQPVIVKLHMNKDSRLLNTGRVPALGVVVVEAKESDLVPISVHRPEPMVWLLQASPELQPGEYALMLGTQNLEIFPFTVIEKVTKSNGTASQNKAN